MAFLIALTAALALLSGAMFWFGSRSLDYDLPLFVGGMILGVGAVIALACTVIVPITRHYDRLSCYSWAEQTGREVKWQAYGYGGLQWDCFVRTSDGRWLPKNQLRDIAP